MKTFYALLAALLLVVILFIAGCGKNDCTECCEKGDVFLSAQASLDVYPFEQFSGVLHPGVFYYYYLPGAPSRVQFFVGNTTDDICTDEHLNIVFSVETFNESPTRPIKIFGEVYWSVFSDEIILWNDVTQTVHSYAGQINDVGLKQAFPEGAATMDIYVTVEYESLGSFELDTAFLRDHINLLYARYEYKKF